MILYDNPASPFCRKVKVLARETGQIDQIEIAHSVGSPVNSEKMPTDHNPLGKIPTLKLNDGAALFDSRVICRYLDDQDSGKFYPSGKLYEVLALEALSDGIMDAAVLMVYEHRARPEGERSPTMIEAQWAKVTRALDHLEANGVSGGFDMGHIALGCALGYLDFRHADRNWRDGRPRLSAWFETVSARDAMVATEPLA
ncbi:glutathione S-transferase [uncultured Litoreibacter sp.]|uniref:glutathione S-transferase n=1 Tax=uncultured Litoreibacter sp. TaxID=1392394 RepID=UPI0026225B73|nr:glutathione S-transferase [uncultured Litoreibacter sp.]